MPQNATSRDPDPLVPLRGNFPGWECWTGTVASLVYARLRKSPTAVVLRDTTADGLAAKMRDWEREHAQQSGIPS